MRFFYLVLLVFESCVFVCVESSDSVKDGAAALSPNYSTIELQVTYRSHVVPKKIYSELMEIYYEFVTDVVDFIVPEALPHGLLSLQPNETLFAHLKNCIWTYRRLFIFIFLLVFQILYLLCGNLRILCSCLFCWLNCCCKRVQPKRKKFKKWTWLLWTYTCLFLLLLVLMMAHQSNQDMDQGIEDASDTIADSVLDIITYIETTADQFEILLIHNLEEYLVYFVKSSEKTTEDIITDLEDTIRNITLSKVVNEIETSFGFVKPIFDEIETLLNDIKSIGATINKDLNGLKNIARNIPCITQQCSDLKMMIPSLPAVYAGGKAFVNRTLHQLGNVAKMGEDALRKGIGEIGNLTDEFVGGVKHLTADVANEIKKDKEALQNLTANIAGEVGNLTSDVENEIRKDKEALQNLTSNIAGNVVGGLKNLTGDLAGGVGNVIGGVGNLTSDVTNEIKKDEEALQNLTSNIAGNVVGGLKNLTGGLAGGVGNVIGGVGNLTSDVTNEIKKDEEALQNLTSNIAGNVVGGLKNLTGGLAGGVGNVIGGVGNLTSDVTNEIKKDEEALQNLTSNIAGNVVGGLKDLTGGLTGGVGNVVGGLGNLTSGVSNEIKKDEEALQNLTSNIAGNVVGGLKDLTGGLTGGVGNVVGGLGNLTSGVSNEIKKDEEALQNLTSNIAGNVVGGLKDLTGGLTGGVGNVVGGLGNLTSDVSNEIKKDEEALQNLTSNIAGNVVGGLKDLTGGLTGGVGNVVGGLGNLTSDVSNEIKKDEEALQNLTSNIAGNVVGGLKDLTGGLTGGVGNVVGGLGNLTSGLSNEMEKDKEALQNLTSNIAGNVVGGLKDLTGGLTGGVGNVIGGVGDEVKKDKEALQNLTSNIAGNVFGGFKDLTSGLTGGVGDAANEIKKDIGNKVAGGLGKVADGIGNVAGGLESKLGSVFGHFRWKRGINFSTAALEADVEEIFQTIEKIEKYIMYDLKNLNNMSAVLSPVVKEVENIIDEVLAEVGKEIKLAAKPLEMFLGKIKQSISYIEHTILNATHFSNDAKVIINMVEPYRYHFSNAISFWLLVSFALLIFGISVRMAGNNIGTKCVFKGGFTLLHLSALLMAIVSLIYIVGGVFAQKVFCETLQKSNENGIMEIIDDVNPAKYGLIIDTNVHKILQNCHKNLSLYDVVALGTVMNLEKTANKFFNIGAIEKKFERLLNLNLNLTKFLPMETIHNIEDDLNFDAIDKILKSPLFKNIEILESQLEHVPLIGGFIKKIAFKIDSFKDKITSLKAPVTNASNAFPNFFTKLKNSIMSIETEVMSVEEEAVGTLKNVVVSFKNTVVHSITAYVVDRLITSIERRVGRCGPLSLAFNSSMDATCRKITTPANGHWVSWFTGVFICIFIICTSRNLDIKLNQTPANEFKEECEEMIELKHIEEEIQIHITATGNKIDVEEINDIREELKTKIIL